MAISHIKSDTIGDFTGTVTIYNSAGNTTTAAATDLVRPSDWNSVHNQYLTIAGNTAGQSTFSGTNLVFAGGSNVTLSGNGSTVSIVGAGNVNFSAGTTSNNLSAVTFDNSNGVSFGLNGSVITATVQTNYLTTARASNDAVGLNTAESNVTWTVNSSGLSFDARGYAGTGTSATNASLTLNSNGLAISVAAGGGGGSVNFSAGTTSNNLGSVVFSNSNGVSFGLNGSTITGSVATSLTNINVSAGTTSNNLSAVTFNNSNGVSFGLNGSVITATVQTNYLTTARASTDAIGLNTAQTNVTWTVNSSGLSLNAAGYAGTGTSATNATVTLNSNGLQISVANPAAGQVNFSAGTTSNNLGSIVFSNANGVSFGLNGSTITASAAGGGGAVQTIGSYPFYPPSSAAFNASTYSGSTASAAAGATTSYTTSISGHARMIELPAQLNMNNVVMRMSFNTNAGTGSGTWMHAVGWYSQTGSTMSLALSYAWNVVYTQNSVTALTMNWWNGTNSTTYSGSSAGNFSVSLTGVNLIDLVDVSGSLAAGEYAQVCFMTNRTSGANVFVNKSYNGETNGNLYAVHSFIGNASQTYPGLGWASGSLTTSYSAAGMPDVVFVPSSFATSDMNLTDDNRSRWPMVFMYSS